MICFRRGLRNRTEPMGNELDWLGTDGPVWLVLLDCLLRDTKAIVYMAGSEANAHVS